MSWLMIVLQMLSFLGPILAELLRNWLQVAASKMPEIPNDQQTISPEEMEQFWNRVLDQIPWRRWAARTLARAAKKLCVARAVELSLAARGVAPTPIMSEAEASAVASEL